MFSTQRISGWQQSCSTSDICMTTLQNHLVPLFHRQGNRKTSVSLILKKTEYHAFIYHTRKNCFNLKRCISYQTSSLQHFQLFAFRIVFNIHIATSSYILSHDLIVSKLPKWLIIVDDTPTAYITIWYCFVLLSRLYEYKPCKVMTRNKFTVWK
jgi:hypothetical protein